MNKTFTHIFFSFILLLSSLQGFSQTSDASKIFDDAKVSIVKSDAKGLTVFFSDKVDLNFDGEIKTYSQAQAEFVLRDFFKKYPVKAFSYDHISKTPEGLHYAIGKYTYNGGAFLVYIMIKDFNGKQIIDTLNFHEEDD